MKDLFDWQDYDDCEIPRKARHGAVYLMVSEEKPRKEDNGFYVNSAFQYTPCNNGEKLWIKFIEDKS